MALIKRNGVYWWKYKRNGKTITEHIGTPDLERARAWRRCMISARWWTRFMKRLEADGLTIDDLLNGMRQSNHKERA